MQACCPPPGAELFTERVARRDARRFRRRGLDPTAQRLVELAARPGATILEIGGGVGGLQIELLRAGAERATNVELSPAYEIAAAELLDEAGLGDRVERRVLDFARAGHEIEPADAVVLHRVVCCYPDMPGLVGAAADKARRTLALSFPRETWWMRVGARAINLWSRLARNEFRFFHYRAADISAVAEDRGLRRTHETDGRIWRIATFERT
jgi:hypothetical protein